MLFGLFCAQNECFLPLKSVLIELLQGHDTLVSNVLGRVPKSSVKPCVNDYFGRIVAGASIAVLLGEPIVEAGDVAMFFEFCAQILDVGVLAVLAGAPFIRSFVRGSAVGGEVVVVVSGLNYLYRLAREGIA